MSRIPDTQVAMAISAPGGPQVLQPRTVPVPAPGPGDVLIEVHAAGINRHDCGQRRRGPSPAHSDVPGLEVAGTVAACGERVTAWQVGDRVCALTDGGGYAPWCIADAGHVLPVPASLSWTDAAAWPEALFTVWLNFFELARLAPGERVLVHGGSSGVGTVAIQVLTALGHAVFATGGRADKCAAALALGAVAAFDYQDPHFAAQVLTATQLLGIDVVLDMSGGRHSAANLRLLAHRGRIVHLSPGEGAHFDAPLRDIMAKQAMVTGSLLRPVPVQDKTAMAQRLRERIWPQVMDGALRAVVHHRYALADAAQAHADMERGEHIGKLVFDLALGPSGAVPHRGRAGIPGNSQ